MIEVEKKFILTSEQENKLIENAEFLGDKVFTDVYYDDAAFSLTSKDLWLRQRSSRFELKVPLNVSIEERVSDQYQELETDSEICGYLHLDIDSSLAYTLDKKGYLPFVSITTTRRKYKKDGFGIDLDSMDFGYTIAEIEFMSDDDSLINETTQNIISFAKKFGIESTKFVRGKVAEYLRRNNPAHFQALIDAKVIK
jgi:adenylate cyclase class IV